MGGGLLGEEGIAPKLCVGGWVGGWRAMAGEDIC
jgi:hypothetical protein